MSTSTHLVVLRLAVIAVAIAPLTLALPPLVSQGSRGERAGPPATAPDHDVPFSRSQPVLGFAIVAHHISNLPAYLEGVDVMSDLGANALVVVTPWFQKRADSSTIRRRPDRCPTPKQLVTILRHAKGRGLRTTLQPIVLIEDPGPKDWRGVIRPEDWDAWWESYHRMIDSFLPIANEADVDLFTMGSELNSTEEQHARWRAVASKVRRSFDGELTYSANWDRYDRVTFWPLVDLISVSSYFELQRDRPGAPEAALVQDWMPIRERLVTFARAWEMPLLLSEVGYPSLPWANAHPWNYVANSTAADHEAQARCYRAFFTAWSDAFADPESPVLGFHCYHWDPYHHGEDTDTGYGIRGKPAFEVLRHGFRRIRGAVEMSASRAVDKSK